MIPTHSIQPLSPEPVAATPVKLRRAAIDNEPAVLTDIYQQDTNIVVWQRELSAALQDAIHHFLASHPRFQSSTTLTPQSRLTKVNELLGTASHSKLSEDIAELVDMFCCLFELKRVGLRLAVLGHAMCPRFHVDNVPCRLATTYHGVATEWLPHQVVDRTRLGSGSNGLADYQSGLYQNEADIQRLSCGDVTLLKGELWEGNETAGLVHRSPALPEGEQRLLLTLDFMN